MHETLGLVPGMTPPMENGRPVYRVMLVGMVSNAARVSPAALVRKIPMGNLNAERMSVKGHSYFIGTPRFHTDPGSNPWSCGANRACALENAEDLLYADSWFDINSLAAKPELDCIVFCG